MKVNGFDVRAKRYHHVRNVKSVIEFSELCQVDVDIFNIIKQIAALLEHLTLNSYV